MQTKLKYLLVSFIVLLTFTVFQEVYSQSVTERKFVIVLDAGHGGHDPGRPTKFATEKEVALKVTLAVGKLLEELDDVEIIYTRKKDVFLELHERAAIANKADADLFVSIHCNAHNTQAYGTETYVMGVGNTDRNFNIAKAENEVILLEENYEKHYQGFDLNSPESLIGLTVLQEDYTEQSILLASLVENSFKNKLKRKSRGVKQQSLWVMHNTYMPSVLIETGFLTNYTEGKYLSTKKGQIEIASAIADAISKYKADVFFPDVVLNRDIVTSPALEASTTDEIYPEITFKVQIAASSRNLELEPYNFKDLQDITKLKKGKIYRYFYGETSNYTQVQKMKEEAKSKGYENCFIVAYKNDERISIKEALKTSLN